MYPQPVSILMRIPIRVFHFPLFVGAKKQKQGQPLFNTYV